MHQRDTVRSVSASAVDASPSPDILRAMKSAGPLVMVTRASIPDSCRTEGFSSRSLIWPEQGWQPNASRKYSKVDLPL